MQNLTIAKPNTKDNGMNVIKFPVLIDHLDETLEVILIKLTNTIIIFRINNQFYGPFNQKDLFGSNILNINRYENPSYQTTVKSLITHNGELSMLFEGNDNKNKLTMNIAFREEDFFKFEELLYSRKNKFYSINKFDTLYRELAQNEFDAIIESNSTREVTTVSKFIGENNETFKCTSSLKINGKNLISVLEMQTKDIENVSTRLSKTLVQDDKCKDIAIKNTPNTEKKVIIRVTNKIGSLKISSSHIAIDQESFLVLMGKFLGNDIKLISGLI